MTVTKALVAAAIVGSFLGAGIAIADRLAPCTAWALVEPPADNPFVRGYVQCVRWGKP